MGFSNQSDKSAITSWNGYLVPTSTERYEFSLRSERRPSPLWLDEKWVEFTIQSLDPSNEWSTKPIKLTAGNLYTFKIEGVALSQIKWKDSISLFTLVPPAVLLPNYSQEGTSQVFHQLWKASILLNPLRLTPLELGYIQKHPNDFKGLDDDKFTLNQLRLGNWKVISEYVGLRDSLPPNTNISLIDLFDWASSWDGKDQAAITLLPKRISDATSWPVAAVNEILEKVNFATADPLKFRNATILTRLKMLFDLSAKANVPFDLLFRWATPHPPSQYWKFHQNAVDIQKAARSRLSPDSWNLAVRPLNNRLRENQRDALISFLLVQDVIMQQSIIDADGLFEFFLIDVQMAPLVETSRIKQAISTVQTYIQRCHLGLEVQNGVDSDLLNRQSWAWMKNYRVWEANRKVFLYPENWIDPALRDDKSDIFRAFEGDLLEKELTKDGISRALRKYVYSVVEVANLIAIALHLETVLPETPTSPPVKLHIFARTRTVPFKYYYRFYTFKTNNWFPWQDMAIEIPHYIVDDDASFTMGQAGNHFAPIIFNGRLLLFLPQITKITVPPLIGSDQTTTFENIGKQDIETSSPAQYWDIKMSWTEFRDGRWSPRQMNPDGLTSPFDKDQDSIDTFLFIPISVSDGPAFSTVPLPPGPPYQITISVYRTNPSFLKFGEFDFAGNQLLSRRSFNSSNLLFGNGELGGLPLSFGYLNNNTDNSRAKFTEVHSYQGYIDGSRIPGNMSKGAGLITKANHAFSEPAVLYPDRTQYPSHIKLNGSSQLFYHALAPEV